MEYSKNYEQILRYLLDQVPADLDKREGSVIFTAVAPVALLTAEILSIFDELVKRFYLDTADGDDLDKKAEEYGLYRYEATHAIREAVMKNGEGLPLRNVPKGSRFFAGESVFTVIRETETPGTYEVEAEEAGEEGNAIHGELIPVAQIQGFASGELGRVLIPGEDEESDEVFKDRVFAYLLEKAFGGNRADYTQKALEIQGVGGVRIERSTDGEQTVGVIVIDSEDSVPSPELIDKVQDLFDPLDAAREGAGLAPINHKVRVRAVDEQPVTLSVTVEHDGEHDVQKGIEETFEGLISELRAEWKRKRYKVEPGAPVTYDPIIVRHSRIAAELLNVPGVVDISDVLLNGSTTNVEVHNAIPKAEGVEVNESQR